MSAILILGGYGGFGGRLSRRLAARGHQVLVAGRNLDRATDFCAGISGCEPVLADRDRDLSELLGRYRPALLIDAAGPFQTSDNSVPEACIAAGVPYLDLADARAFVTGICRLDAAARAANIPIVSGASSVPALSGAVVRHLAAGLDAISAVEIAISASNRAAAGASVTAAILSYVGRPVRIWRGAYQTTAFGWHDLRRERIALTDGTGLGTRLVGIADVPDLDLLPERLPGRPMVSFRAGTELGFQNRALWLAGWAVRWNWIGSLPRLMPLLRVAHRATARLGSDRSGMVVRVFGRSDGKRIERRWTLIACNGDGPEIPTLAATLLADRTVAATIAPGARDAGMELALPDFEPLFATLAIRHERRDVPQPEPLYARVMGDRFSALAPAVADMHGVLRESTASGRATVGRGRHPLARLLARLMRFPDSGEHALTVEMSERDGVEQWTRDFSGQRFSSHLSQDGSDLVERFGPLRFRFALPTDGNGLRMVMHGWSFAGIPLPLWLAPRSEAREWEENGRFHFDVPISFPLAGKIVHYRGWLMPPE